MTRIASREGINFLAQYLGDAYDTVPPQAWLNALSELDQTGATGPAHVAEALERILDLAREAEQSALPCMAQLVIATGTPPKPEDIRAEALRFQGPSELACDVLPDMLLAPDRYLTQQIDVSLEDGALEIAVPRLHPGPNNGAVLVWLGAAAGSPRAWRHWQEQRDHLAASDWVFEGGQTVRPVDHAPDCLAAGSLPEARFLRHVIALPATVLDLVAAGASTARARVAWPFGDCPDLLANVALVGFSGAGQYTILRSVTADAQGHAEACIADGALHCWPLTVRLNDTALRRAHDGSGDVAPDQAVWSFDAVEHVVLIDGLIPGETVDLTIDLRLRRTSDAALPAPKYWSGPGAMRWSAAGSLLAEGRAPDQLTTGQIVTSADLRSALLSLDPFPETLRVARAEVDVAPRLFVTDEGLRLGFLVGIDLPEGRGTKVPPHVCRAVQTMLQRSLHIDMPVHLEVHHDY